MHEYVCIFRERKRIAHANGLKKKRRQEAERGGGERPETRHLSRGSVLFVGKGQVVSVFKVLKLDTPRKKKARNQTLKPRVGVIGWEGTKCLTVFKVLKLDTPRKKKTRNQTFKAGGLGDWLGKDKV